MPSPAVPAKARHDQCNDPGGLGHPGPRLFPSLWYLCDQSVISVGATKGRMHTTRSVLQSLSMNGVEDYNLLPAVDDVSVAEEVVELRVLAWQPAAELEQEEPQVALVGVP